MMTDPISDLLTRLRNACHSRHPKVDIPASKTKVGIVELLKQSGYIKNYKLFRHEGKGVLRIYLKYLGKDPAIQGVRRISRPSRRAYSRYTNLPKVRGGLGMLLVSTSKGIISDHSARESKIGGEVLCSVW